jgi:hypothetical protein
MTTALDALNAALYGSQPPSWEGSALAEAARRLRSKHRGKVERKEPSLQLYPQAT